MVIRSLVGQLAGRLKDITNTHIEDIEALLDKQTGRKTDIPYGIAARRDYGDLVIERKRDTELAADTQDNSGWEIEKTELLRYSEKSRWSERIKGITVGETGKAELCIYIRNCLIVIK